MTNMYELVAPPAESPPSAVAEASLFWGVPLAGGVPMAAPLGDASLWAGLGSTEDKVLVVLAMILLYRVPRLTVVSFLPQPLIFTSDCTSKMSL